MDRLDARRPIEDAYRAMMGEIGWDQWALDFMTGFDGSGGVAGIVNVEDEAIDRLLGISLVPAALDDYLGGYCTVDPQIAEVREFAGAGTYIDFPHADRHSPAIADYVRWHHWSARVEHHLTAVIPLDAHRYRFGISIHQHRGSPRSPLVHRDALAALLPELGRTLKMAFRHGEELTDAYWEGANAGRDLRAALLLDEYGRVIRINAAAEALLAASMDLTISRGRLSCIDPSGETRLTALIARALSSHDASTIALQLSGPDWPRPLSVICHRIPRRSLSFSPSEASVLLTIVDPSRSDEQRQDLFQGALGLSRRESEFALTLLNGHSAESAASALGISLATARSHLRQLFEKTGVAGQPQLLATLARISSS